MNAYREHTAQALPYSKTSDLFGANLILRPYKNRDTTIAGKWLQPSAAGFEGDKLTVIWI
jgi:hypothetical protein